MISATTNWTEIKADQSHTESMSWPSKNCTGIYYKYFREGGYYIKFELEQDAIMFRLKFG